MNSSYGSLAYTGLGTISLFGFAINQAWLVAAAVGVVAIGVVLVRISFRRHKSHKDV